MLTNNRQQESGLAVLAIRNSGSHNGKSRTYSSEADCEHPKDRLIRHQNGSDKKKRQVESIIEFERVQPKVSNTNF